MCEKVIEYIFYVDNVGRTKLSVLDEKKELQRNFVIQKFYR